MHGRVVNLIRVALAALALILARPVPSFGQHPVIEVQQRMPQQIESSEAIPVEIVVSNTGKAPAENVAVSGCLPPGCDLLNVEPAPERVHDALRWSLGTVEPGGQRIVRLRLAARPGATTPVRSSLTVTYQASVETSSATVIKRPVLALDVVEPPAGNVGEPMALLLTVRNAGAAVARDVSLQTVLPAGLSHPGGGDLENEVGTLEAGETRQIALTVTPAQAGEFHHTIRLAAHGADPVEREVRLRVQEVKLTLSARGPRLLYENWPGSFEIDVRNDGTEVIRQVCLTAGLPEGLAYVRASDDGTYDAQNHCICWNVGTLPAGTARTLVWNGVARATGDLVCKVRLAAGPQAHKEVTWQTSVVKATAAAPARTAPTPAPPTLPPAAGAPSTGPAPVPAVPGTALGDARWRPAMPSSPPQPAPPGPGPPRVDLPPFEQYAGGWKRPGALDPKP
jgi:uncharacterized repeat protein (TIGR01451 family)